MLSRCLRLMALVPTLAALPAFADSSEAQRFETKMGPADSGDFTVPYAYDTSSQLSWAHAPWNYFSFVAKDPCRYLSGKLSFAAPTADQLNTLLNPVGVAASFPGGLHGDFFTTTRNGEDGYVVNFDTNEGRFTSLPTNAPWGAGVPVLCVLQGPGPGIDVP